MFTAAAYYVGYLEGKYRLRISLVHPRDWHFAHVQWLPLSIEKPQAPFCEIRVILFETLLDFFTAKWYLLSE